MLTYYYYEPGDDGVTPVKIVKTEKEIIEEYYKYWEDSVIEVHGIEYFNKIENPEEECIIDWQVVNWAEVLKGEESETENGKSC